MDNAHPLNDIGKEALLHNVLFRSSASACVKNIVLWTPSTRSETIDILSRYAAIEDNTGLLRVKGHRSGIFEYPSKQAGDS